MLSGFNCDAWQSSACNFKCTFCPTGDRELIKSTGRYQGALALGGERDAIGQGDLAVGEHEAAHSRSC